MPHHVLAMGTVLAALGAKAASSGVDPTLFLSSGAGSLGKGMGSALLSVKAGKAAAAATPVATTFLSNGADTAADFASTGASFLASKGTGAAVSGISGKAMGGTFLAKGHGGGAIGTSLAKVGSGVGASKSSYLKLTQKSCFAKKKLALRKPAKTGSKSTKSGVKAKAKARKAKARKAKAKAKRKQKKEAKKAKKQAKEKEKAERKAKEKEASETKENSGNNGAAGTNGDDGAGTGGDNGAGTGGDNGTSTGGDNGASTGGDNGASTGGNGGDPETHVSHSVEEMEALPGTVGYSGAGAASQSSSKLLQIHKASASTKASFFGRKSGGFGGSRASMGSGNGGYVGAAAAGDYAGDCGSGDDLDGHYENGADDPDYQGHGPGNTPSPARNVLGGFVRGAIGADPNPQQSPSLAADLGSHLGKTLLGGLFGGAAGPAPAAAAAGAPVAAATTPGVAAGAVGSQSMAVASFLPSLFGKLAIGSKALKESNAGSRRQTARCMLSSKGYSRSSSIASTSANSDSCLSDGSASGPPSARRVSRSDADGRKIYYANFLC